MFVYKRDIYVEIYDDFGGLISHSGDIIFEFYGVSQRFYVGFITNQKARSAGYFMDSADIPNPFMRIYVDPSNHDFLYRTFMDILWIMEFDVALTQFDDIFWVSILAGFFFILFGG